MADELRRYHVDDPNDAPERRSFAFPTIPQSLSLTLPPYVIPPVANSLYTAMQFCWYKAYQEGVAAQKHQHQAVEAQAHQQLQQQLNYNRHLHNHHDRRLHNHHNHHLHNHHEPSSPSTSTSTAHSLASSASTTSSSIAGSSSPASLVTSTTPASNHQHIKKPLNPFMIYMQKRRPEIVKQGIIRESAAINQMLGQQWRRLSKEEQEPYYKLAEQEKLVHAQKYPGWSARDNYANQKKKKKKMQLKSLNGLDQSDKKCRARFGLNNMCSWCKPCRRKKKCILLRKPVQE